MAKSIELLCPAKITLFLNKYESNNMKKFKVINQTINLYDKLVISEDKKQNNGIKIITNNKKILTDQDNICYKTCCLFFEYTNIYPKTFNVYIEKGIPILKGLSGGASSAAGLLKGLNEYYHTNLTKEEMMSLAFKINEEVPYFLVSGYAKITDNPTNINKMHDNPYNSYLIIEPDFIYNKEEINLPNKEIIRLDNQHLYNDYSFSNKDELIELKNFLNSCSGIKYLKNACGPSYFLPFKEKNINSGLKIKLKKEFPNFNIYTCHNEKDHKMLIKYPHKLDI